MIEKHYTTAQVAEFLACSTDTVLRLAQRGELRSIYVGSERRYPQSSVEEFINRNAAASPLAQVVPLRETRTSPNRRSA